MNLHVIGLDTCLKSKLEGNKKSWGAGQSRVNRKVFTEGFPGGLSFGLNRTGDLVISSGVFGNLDYTWWFIVYMVVVRRSREKTQGSSFVQFHGEQRKPLTPWTGCYLGNSGEGVFACLYHMDSNLMFCFIFQAGMLSLVQWQEEIWDQVWFLWLIFM